VTSALQRPRAAFPAAALLCGPARSCRRPCAAGSDSAFRRIAGCKDEIASLARAGRRPSAASPRSSAASAGRLRDSRGSPLSARGSTRRAPSFSAHADQVRVHLGRGPARPGAARLSSRARVPARRRRRASRACAATPRSRCSRDSPFEARRRQAESTFFLRQCFA
jgi:hypothetical protein